MPPEKLFSAEEPFGVYVHWPFCAAKCPYCDFNSHVRHGGIDEERFLAGYLNELAYFANLTPGRTVTSIFFGGGTPSLMAPHVTGAILDEIARHWHIAPDVEITLEANPTSVEAKNFRGYQEAGVNRLSLGVQALNDESLERLGRQHSAAEALTALALARETFGRISFDLIYAREGQTARAWEGELKTALGFAADHLSLYQLTIEEGTPFARLHEAGRLRVPASKEAGAMYAATQEICEAAGLPAYEISNHAVPGAQSRHNLLYWRGNDYAGIGAGAHSRITAGDPKLKDNNTPKYTKRAFSTLHGPEDWLAQSERLGHGMASVEVLSREEAAEEYLLMALRLREGLDMGRFEALGGNPLDPARLKALEADGFLRQGGRSIAATQKGRLVLERLILELAA